MKLRYGTELTIAGGRIARVVDRAGHIHATVRWTGDGALGELVVTGAIVRGAVIEDPLLGRAHAIAPVGTTLSAIDWARPTEIPAVAAPGKLPPGSGGSIMNVLAHLARWADVGALRYAGPYNTPALYRALLRSFHTTASEAEFCADAYARAGRIARDPLPFDFAPDPCERVAIPGGWVELRRGLERVVHHGVSYEGAGGVTRLVPDVDGTWAAEVWFGDQRYARVATVFPDGNVLTGPHPIPACASSVIGRAFPAPLRAALAGLVAELVPAPLADRAREIVAERPLEWVDLGARAAKACSHATGPRGFEVHAAIWEKVAPHGMARVALAIAEAIAPVVTTTILSELVVHFAP